MKRGGSKTRRVRLTGGDAYKRYELEQSGPRDIMRDAEIHEFPNPENKLYHRSFKTRDLKALAYGHKRLPLRSCTDQR
jgi:hypothetical protein